MRKFAPVAPVVPFLVQVTAIGLALGAVACSSVALRPDPTSAAHPAGTFRSQLLAVVPNPPSGLAVTPAGEIFVALPREPVVPRMFEETRGASLVAVGTDGALLDYPNSEWNRWDGASGPSATTHFVSLGGLALAGDTLWVVDSGRVGSGAAVAPGAGVPGSSQVAGGAKLVAISLATDQVLQALPLEGALAADSDLAELAIDPTGAVAVISDPGAAALVVVDLKTGTARRVLADQPSTRAEAGVVVTSLGLPAVHGDGRPLSANVRALALDPAGKLYFAALASHSLYRVSLAALADANLAPDALAGQVEKVAQVPLIGALAMVDGTLLVADLQNGTISSFDRDFAPSLGQAPAAGDPANHLSVRSSSPEFSFPSALQRGRSDHLYFAASPQRSASAVFDRGLDPAGPAGVYISYPSVGR